MTAPVGSKANMSGLRRRSLFTQRDLGHARIADRRLSGITEVHIVRFTAFVEWFVDSVKRRLAV